MPAYEVIYILDPALTEEQTSEAIQRFTQVARDHGAAVQEPQRWPKRRLAYPIKGKSEGLYVITTVEAEPSAVAELTRVLKLAESVLRHMVVTLEAEKEPAEGAQGSVQ